MRNHFASTDPFGALRRSKSFASAERTLSHTNTVLVMMPWPTRSATSALNGCCALLDQR
jgi:hypothetical protein